MKRPGLVILAAIVLSWVLAVLVVLYAPEIVIAGFILMVVCAYARHVLDARRRAILEPEPPRTAPRISDVELWRETERGMELIRRAGASR